MKESIMKFTLVQHSGYGYGGKLEFVRAVQIQTLVQKRLVEQVLKAGGVVFDSMLEADEREYAENYPDREYGGLIPHVLGRFSDKKIDGLRIYIPARKEEQVA